MKKKVTVIGALIILSALFLMQMSMVYAAKPVSIYFYSNQWGVYDSSMIYDDDGRPWIGQFYISGVMYKGLGLFPPILGNFSCVDTVTYYYDNAGSSKYELHNQVLTIYCAGGDTLTINDKFKFVPGVPLTFQRPGSWTIVGGTGFYAAVSGRGEYEHPFQFYGTIS